MSPITPDQYIVEHNHRVEATVAAVIKKVNDEIPLVTPEQFPHKFYTGLTSSEDSRSACEVAAQRFASAGWTAELLKSGDYWCIRLDLPKQPHTQGPYR